MLCLILATSIIGASESAYGALSGTGGNQEAGCGWADRAQDALSSSAEKGRRAIFKWIERPEAEMDLAWIFPGPDGRRRTPAVSRVSEVKALLAPGRPLPALELRSHVELRGALAAFSSSGTQGRPAIYINRDWLGAGTSASQIEAVIIEELGHYIDHVINQGLDSPGDEGELFAAAVLGIPLSPSALARIAHEDDSAVLVLDGEPVAVEMAQLLFTNQAYFIANPATLEQINLEIGAPVPGVHFLFTSDPTDAFFFSGNNVRGTLYAVDAADQIIGSYFGEISRLLKSGSNVQAFQFYVYGEGQPLPPGNQTPQLTIIINSTAALAPGQFVKTSSDPVSPALNRLLTPNFVPVAVADTDSVLLPSCTVAQERTVVTGNVITGAGSDGNPDGADTDANTIYLFDPDPLLSEAPFGTLIESSDLLRVSAIRSNETGASAVVASSSPTSLAGLYGTLEIAASGSYSYTVNPANPVLLALPQGATLSEAFTYTIADSRGATASTTLTLTLVGGDDAPVAVDDYRLIDESPTRPSTLAATTAATGVLANDSDPDAGSTLTVTRARQVSSLADETFTSPVTVTANGVEAFSRTVQFTFNEVGNNSNWGGDVGDAVFIQRAGTNTWTNTGLFVNSRTTGGAVKFMTFRTTAAGSTLGYLDFRVGDVLSFVTAGTSSGTISAVTASSFSTTKFALAGTGSTPTVGALVTGEGLQTETAVAAVETIATIGTYITLSKPATASTTTNNASTLFPGESLSFLSGDPIFGTYGYLNLRSDGSYEYIQTADVPGGALADEFFRIEVSDGACTSTSVLHLQIIPVQVTPPVANPDFASVTEAGVLPGTSPATGNVITGGVPDTGSPPLQVVRTWNPAAGTSLQVNAGSSSGFNAAEVDGLFGTLFIGADGSFSYVLNDADPQVDSLSDGSSLTEVFYYQLNDGQSTPELSISTLTVTILGANDAPVANPGAAIAVEAGGFGNSLGGIDPTGNLFLNDTDVDAGDAFTLAGVGAGTPVALGTPDEFGEYAVPGSYGTLFIKADGSYRYEVDQLNPAVEALTSSDDLEEVFNYRVADSQGANADSTLTITIHGADDIVEVDSIDVNEGSPHAVFTVTGAPGQAVTLLLGETGDGEGDATRGDSGDFGTDAGTGLEIFDGTDWVAYLGGSVTLDGAGVLRVRTVIRQDTVLEDQEAFVLVATTLDGGTSIGTAVIFDDGTGSYWIGDALEPATPGELTDAGILLDDDRALEVTSVTVNEASDWAVFSVTGNPGQFVILGVLQGEGPGFAELGTPTIQVWDGNAWLSYGAAAQIPAGGVLHVRVDITAEQDSEFEGAETFALVAANSGGSGYSGTGTIVDDGTGVIFNGASDADPSDPANTIATGLDDDRSPPVLDLSAQDGDTLNRTIDFIEKGAPVFLGESAWANIGDVDRGTLAQLTLRIDRTTLQLGEQLLVQTGAGTVLIPLGVAAALPETTTATVVIGGQAFRYTIADLAGIRTITFTSRDAGDEADEAAPPAAFEGLIDALAFESTSNNFTDNSTRSFSVTISDGTATSEPALWVVTMLAVNDPPTSADVTRNTYVGGGVTLTGGMFAFADIDGHEFLAVKLESQIGLLIDHDDDPGTPEIFLQRGSLDLRLAEVMGAGGTLANASNAVITVSVFSWAITGEQYLTSNEEPDPARPGFDAKLDGKYGTLFLNSATGQYVYERYADGQFIDSYTGTGTSGDPWVPVKNPLLLGIGQQVTEGFLIQVNGTEERLLTFFLTGTGDELDPVTIEHHVAVPIEVGDFIAIEDIRAGKVRFATCDCGVIRQREDGSFYPGPGLFARFEFRVQDDGGTANGGNDLSEPYVFTLVALSADGAIVEVPLEQVMAEDSVLVFGSDLQVGYPGTDLVRVTVSLSGLSRTGSLGLLQGSYPGVTIDTTSFAGIQLVGTLADVNAALAELTFTPAADQFSALDEPDYPAADGQGIGSTNIFAVLQVTAQNIAGEESFQYPVDFKTVDIIVYATNDAPTSDDARVEVGSGSPYTFQLADFPFADAVDEPEPNALAAVEIVSLPTNGVLKLGGAVLTAGDLSGGLEVTRAQLIAGELTFEPDSGFTSGTTSFGFRVRDDGGTKDGGVDLSAATYTFSIDVYGVSNVTVNEASPWAVFTVEGPVGGEVELAVIQDTGLGFANLGTPAIQYWNGFEWVAASSSVTVPGGGVLYVRVDITHEADTVFEGAETFRLAASTGSGAVFEGTGTIIDDGTGVIFSDGPTADPTDPQNTITDTGLDDDRTALVSSPTVNEASPFAVFTISGTADQLVSLALEEGTATLAEDFGPGLQVFNGTQWVDYTAGTLVPLDSTGKLLVRTPVINDEELEVLETFKLVATNSGGSSAEGTASIFDEANGSIFLDTNTTGTPDDPTDSGYTGPVLDDDRALAVSSVTVNEASPYAVFSVTALTGGRIVSLALGDPNDTATFGVDYGNTPASGLQIFDGSGWVDYMAGTFVPLAGSGPSELLVRTPVVQDDVYEVSEFFTLAAFNTGGARFSGTGTIDDDGNGVIFLGDNNSTTPDDPTDPGYTGPRLDDDRPPIANLGGAAPGFGGTSYGETTLSSPPGTFSQALTVEVWARLDLTSLPEGPYQVLLAKGGDWLLRRNVATNALEFVTSGLSTPVLSVPGTGFYPDSDDPYALFDGEFHHFAAVYDAAAGTKAIYADGRLIASVAGLSGTLDDSTNVFRIGADGAVVDPLDDLSLGGLWIGLLDEVRVWNVVRDGGQISTMRQRLLKGFEFGLVHYWRFEEGAGLNSGDLLSDPEAPANQIQFFGGLQWIRPEQAVERLLALSGMDLDMQLGGYSRNGDPVVTYITALPGVGEIYQRLPSGERGARITQADIDAGLGLSANPGEVRIDDPLGRVIYVAPDALLTDEPLETFAEGSVKNDFAAFSYVVKRGNSTSDPETVTIDVETVSLLGGTALELNLDPDGTTVNRALQQYVLTPNLRDGFVDNAVTIEVWFRAQGSGVLVTELGQPQIDIGWQNSQIEVVTPSTTAGYDADVRVRVWNLPEATASSLVNGLLIGPINFGEWNHAAVRYDPEARRLDGALNGVITATRVSGDRQAPWETIVVNSWNQASRAGLFYAFGARDLQHLGSGAPTPRTPFNNHFPGAVDEVRIWNEAVPDDRLARDHTRFLEGDTDRLVALYRFDEPQGGTVFDISRSPARNATIFNGGRRVRSQANLNTSAVRWGDARVIEIPGFDNLGSVYGAQITRMPLFGALHQYDDLAPNGLGERIVRVPTAVNDPRRRVVFTPAFSTTDDTVGSRFDSFEYLTTGAGGAEYGTRRLRFQVERPNLPPVFAAVQDRLPLVGAVEGEEFLIEWVDPLLALGASDPNDDLISLRIESVPVGSLQIEREGERTPVVPRFTIMGPGERLFWTPPPYVNVDNSGLVGAFTVRAFDGRDFSANDPATVQIEISPADSAPVAEYPGPALALEDGAYVYTPNLRPLFRTDSVTIEVWFRAEGPGVLISERGTANATGWSNSQIELVDAGGGKAAVRVAVRGLSGPFGSGLYLGEVEYGTWNHAALRYDESDLTLSGFLNGTTDHYYDGQKRDVPWRNGFTGLFYGIGMADPINLGSGAPFRGVVREVRIWKTSRSDGTLIASVPEGLTGDEPGLAVWYRFDEGSGVRVVDYGPHRPGGPLGPTPGQATLDASLINNSVWVDNQPLALANEPLAIRLLGYHPDQLPFSFEIVDLPTAGALFQYEAGMLGAPIVGGGAVSDPLGRVFYEHSGAAESSFTYRVRDLAPRNLVSDPATVNVRVIADPGISAPGTGGGDGSPRVRPRTLAEVLKVTGMATVAGPVGGAGLFDASAPASEIDPAARLRLEFLIDRRHGFVVEVSDDLMVWNPVMDVTIDEQRSTLEHYAVVAEVNTAGTHRFLRVRVGL